MNWRDYDWPLFGAILFLIGSGLLMLAAYDMALFYKQLIWVFGATIVFIVVSSMNIRSLLRYRWIILGGYLSVLLLLIITTFFAPTIAGTKSWLVLGPVHLQPSEFMKVALILLFSKFFALRHIMIARWSTILVSALYAFVPIFFILLQPDMGTALILLGIWFGYLLVGGMPMKRVLTFLIVFALVGAIGWFNVLESYQKDRIKALFNPNYDPLGINYNVIQSKIAIGSGGMLGKGFGQGTQVQLGFLPESQTDFAFAAFVEEWGMLGGLLIITAFGVVVYRLLMLGLHQTDSIIRLISLGTVLFLMIHFVVNLGSVLGLLPVIGVSLPFVSYGGSNLLTVAILIGIINGTAGKRVSF